MPHPIQFSYKKYFVFTIFSVYVFLLPIKFALPACLPETAIFPVNYAEWLYFSWPPVFFTLIACVLCVLVQLLSHKVHSKEFCLTSLCISLLWSSLLIASLPGFINASCRDFPILNMIFMSGIAVTAFSAYFLLESDPDLFKKCIIASVVYGTLAITIYGLYQYYYGFNETRNIIASLAEKNNVKLSCELQGKLDQDLVFSTFSISNNFAAHLILTIPVCLWFIWNRVKISFVRLPVFIIAAAILLNVLALSGSRAAIVSLLSAIIIMGYLFTKSKIRFCLLALSCLFLVIIYFFVFNYKESGSLLIRLDYYRAALILFFRHFFTGAGWGEYFFQYSSLKLFVSNEASHTPHCFILNFACHSGILAFIASAAVLLLPSFICYKSLKKNTTLDIFTDYRFAVLLGWTAWSIHSLMDINGEIPATMAVAVILTVWMVFDNEKRSNSSRGKFIKSLNLIIALLCLLICGASTWFTIQRLNGEITIRNMNSLCSSIDKLFGNKSKDPKTALSEISDILETSDKDISYSPVPYMQAGVFAMENKMWAMAENCFAEAIRRSPENSFYYYSIAMAEYFSGNKNNALINMKKAADLFPFKYKAEYEAMRDNNQLCPSSP